MLILLDSKRQYTIYKPYYYLFVIDKVFVVVVVSLTIRTLNNGNGFEKMGLPPPRSPFVPSEYSDH